MRLFTSDVEQALDTFDLTYDLRQDAATGRWQYDRTGWPEAGGAIDQQARLLDALEVIRKTRTTLLKGAIRTIEKRREKDGTWQKNSRSASRPRTSHRKPSRRR